MFRRLAAQIDKLRRFNTMFAKLELQVRISSALSRAAATAPLRLIDPLRPLTWEFNGFSEHGEDGIIDYLCSQITTPNRFFFEIGAADGIQNCTAWLAFAKGYAGVWVEGDSVLCARARMALEGTIWNVHVINRFVELESVPSLLKMCPHQHVFSLDIDGVDYHIARRVLEIGFRPKIWVVEYNSVFGPELALTVPYSVNFSRWSGQHSGLYYGCSIAGWRTLFSNYDYAFVTVESSGTNAFFIDSTAFGPSFADRLRGEVFLDNASDCNEATCVVKDADGHDVLSMRDWRTQSGSLAGLPLVEIR